MKQFAGASYSLNDSVLQFIMFDNLFKKNRSQEYKYGFQTDVDTSVLKEGLSEETLYYISSRKQEPSWML